MFLRTVLNAEEITTKIFSHDIAVNQGSGSYIDVFIERATNIGALELVIQYDPQISTGGYYVGSMISSQLYDLNLNTRGEMRFSLTSLDGMTGDGHLFSVYIQVPSTMSIGDYFVTIAIHDVYDTNRTPIEVDGSTHKIKVLTPQTANLNGQIYDNVTNNNLKLGDTFTYNLTGYNLNQLVAGELNITYDALIIQPKEIFVNGHFSLTGSFYSLNDSIPGQIKLVFAIDAFLDYLNAIIQVEFEVIQNTTTSSMIQTELINAYSQQLESIQFNKTSQTIQLSSSIIPVNYSNMFTTTHQGPANQSFTIDVNIEPLSGLAAGDFILNYNPNHLTVLTVEVGSTVAAHGGLIMYHPAVDQGEIKFTYINENGLTVEETLLKITFQPKYDNFNLETNLSLKQVGDLVDKRYQPVILEYKPTTIRLFEVKTYHFLTFDGSIHQTIKTDINSTITLPDGPDREGTTFKSWVLQSDTNNIATYVPTYTLLEGSIDIFNLFKRYDGLPLLPKMDTEVTGVSYTVQGSSITQIGIFELEIDIYLDDVFQFTVVKKAFILDNITTISISSKPIIESYVDIKGQLSEKDQITFDIILQEAISNYDLWVNNINQEYEIAKQAKHNLNFFMVVITLQATMSVYYWRKKS